MITKIKFKCISRGGVRNIVIPIEHNITAPKKVGDRWESIESQVIDYLDSIDKWDLMVKYDIDMILDYIPYHKRNKGRNEGEEFRKFCYNFCWDEVFISKIGAVANVMKKELFGKGYSNKRKLEIILSAMNFGYRMTENVLKQLNEDLNNLNKEFDCLENKV